MRTFLFLVVLFIGIASAKAQEPAPYKVVIDVTSEDTLVHQMVVRWLGEITADPKAQVEVVFYSGSLPMVTRDRSVVSKQIVEYAARPNVSMKVCEQTLKRKKVGKDQLLEGVATVPDGIYEIVQRQHEGWGYIKAAR